MRGVRPVGYLRRHMSTSGSMLGERYRIDGLIGRGGMATVWRAHDTVLDREVAVKRLHARLHGDRELEERFRREGRLVANLSHPNLVRLLDQGSQEDEPFLVFELVDGQDLKTILRQHGRMPFERAASVCAQVARALAVAHRAGVVHRDIKSHNVLVTKEGVAKLTDFGIARIVESDGDLTRTGIVIGSSDYLSPEQAEGKQLDGRSDIYSLGVVLFEALTGRLPFTGENPVAVATKHVYDDPPDPREYVPDIPATLAESCMRALSKDPRDRFSTGDTMAQALLGGEIEEVQPPPDMSETTSRMKAVRGPRPQQSPRRGERGRRGAALAWIAAVVALGAAVGVIAPKVMTDRSPGGGSTTASIAFAATDYDPLGDQHEHSDQIPNLTDGNAATVWSTETYTAATPTFGKGGVGLALTLTGTHSLREVRLTTTTPGAIVRVLGAGTTLDARPILSQDVTLVDGANTIALTNTAAQGDIVIWITRPGDQRVDGGFRATIGQVEVMGVANSSR